MSVAAAILPVMMQWFPFDPGPNDAMHLVFEHPCPLVIEQARLRWTHPWNSESWELLLDTHDSPDCALDPLPPSLKRLYAVPIPETVHFPGHWTAWISSVKVRHDFAFQDGAIRSLTYDVPSPDHADMPASLAGIWNSPRHHAQGVSLHVDSEDRLIFSWNTYDRAGNPLWLLGTASNTKASASSTPILDTIRFDLVSVSGGSFAGNAPATAMPELS